MGGKSSATDSFMALKDQTLPAPSDDTEASVLFDSKESFTDRDAAREGGDDPSALGDTGGSVVEASLSSPLGLMMKMRETGTPTAL